MTDAEQQTIELLTEISRKLEHTNELLEQILSSDHSYSITGKIDSILGLLREQRG